MSRSRRAITEEERRDSEEIRGRKLGFGPESRVRNLGFGLESGVDDNGNPDSEIRIIERLTVIL